jgi:UDPglucose 6-dehydrogenase
MRIVVVGTGYVGLVTGTCFAEMGIRVTCVDIDQAKIERLQNGIIPIFEPGLDELVAKNIREGRLHFSTSLKECLEGVEVIFSAVGTPPDEDGSADLQYVLDVARTIGAHANHYFTLITKSTVPVGTALKVKAVIQEELTRRGVDLDFDVAANPEFLKEGAAIKDFMTPDRVVIGVESERSKRLMEKIYKPFTLNGYPVIFMDIPSAEMTKYAANAMLATRISFMNEIANLCERLGANVDDVRKGIGSDARIGSKFLYAGAGYGGSCFPKDVKALSKIGEQHGCKMRIVDAVEEVNELQKQILFTKLQTAFQGNLQGKTIALWGLSFKPETDDMRDAPSLILIDKLLHAGAIVRAFDPVAMPETKRRLGNTITYCTNKDDAAKGADAIVLVTEWKQFRLVDWVDVFSSTKGKIIIDGRNIYDEKELKDLGANYYRIGKETR